MPDPSRHRVITHQSTATGLRGSTGHGSLPVLGRRQVFLQMIIAMEGSSLLSRRPIVTFLRTKVLRVSGPGTGRGGHLSRKIKRDAGPAAFVMPRSAAGAPTRRRRTLLQQLTTASVQLVHSRQRTCRTTSSAVVCRTENGFHLYYGACTSGSAVGNAATGFFGIRRYFSLPMQTKATNRAKKIGGGRSQIPVSEADRTRCRLRLTWSRRTNKER